MRERVVKIGLPKPLIGVLCEPEKLADDKVAVILLNSGIMHRIGSCRLSVKIARSLSEQCGLMNLRFDFSGIGDSEARSGEGVDFSQTVVEEVREAMDFLQQTRGISSFILYGLCSGAHTACKAGLVDDRVIAITQIDGHCYATFKSKIRYYLPSLMSTERWRARLLKLFTGAGIATEGGFDVDDPYFEVPAFGASPQRVTIADRLSRLVAKNIQMYCIYTGRQPTYMYVEQFKDCYHEVDFGDLLTLDYYPDASHIISQPAIQKQVTDGIVNWVARVMRDR